MVNEILKAEAAAVQARKNECPACSGPGTMSDDPQVLKCTRCGGIYTPIGESIVGEAAIKFVAYHLPMLANAGTDGQFYFDLVVFRPSDGGKTRMHGWADRKTRRVVQWG